MVIKVITPKGMTYNKSMEIGNFNTRTLQIVRAKFKLLFIVFLICFKGLNLGIKFSNCPFLCHNGNQGSFELMRISNENRFDWICKLSHHLFVYFLFFFNQEKQILSGVKSWGNVHIIDRREILSYFIWFKTKYEISLKREFISKLHNYI